MILIPGLQGAKFAFCTLCNVNIAISGSAVHEVKQHSETLKHQRPLEGMKAQFVKHTYIGVFFAIIVRPMEIHVTRKNKGNLEAVVKGNSHGRWAGMCICNLLSNPPTSMQPTAGDTNEEKGWNLTKESIYFYLYSTWDENKKRDSTEETKTTKPHKNRAPRYHYSRKQGQEIKQFQTQIEIPVVRKKFFLLCPICLLLYWWYWSLHNCYHQEAWSNTW